MRNWTAIGEQGSRAWGRCAICDLDVEGTSTEDVAARLNLHHQAVHPEITRTDQIDQARAAWLKKVH